MDLRKIDSLVAEKVMGWEKLNKNFWNNKGAWIPVNTFNPSTNIQDAWDVVEKLREKDIPVSIHNDPNFYYVDFTTYQIETLGKSKAETAPLAICLAALKAVGLEVEVDG